MVETIRFVCGNLPHWLVADRPYFVTIRLRGTLPKHVMQGIRAERDALERSGCRDEGSWSDMRKWQFVRMEQILDASRPDRAWLTRGDVPKIVVKGIGWLREEAGWLIHAAVVMPNHIHIVMRNTAGRNGRLLSDLERFKRFTGRLANDLLGRTGTFWARENFDHWCRTPEKTEAAVQYVKSNPVKAGLVDRSESWPWIVIE